MTVPVPLTADPTHWRHAEECGLTEFWADRCYCGLSAVRDAIAAGHRVVIGPDGVEGRLDTMGEYERRATYGEPAYHLAPIEEATDE